MRSSIIHIPVRYADDDGDETNPLLRSLWPTWMGNGNQTGSYHSLISAKESDDYHMNVQEPAEREQRETEERRMEDFNE